MTSSITLIPSTLADYPTIQNLARFYVYDISQYCGGEDGWQTPEDGLYECRDFKHYFEGKENFPFIVRVRDELAGFVIVDKKGSTPDIDFNMAQFFIVRKFKGQGVGKIAARTSFEMFKGAWEVMVMPPNTGAYAFWKKTIGSYTDKVVEYSKRIPHLENCEKDIFRFES
jgi:ribosomal-protein-alanine N-acetyltransferase